MKDYTSLGLKDDIERLVVERKQVVDKLHESEKLYQGLFDNMLNGFAYCRMLYENGQPSDFIYLSVNSAFEKQTGLKNVTGKKASEAIPGIQKSDHNLIERYGQVVSTGTPETFEVYVESLKMWFTISAYSPQKEHFVSIFDVVTKRKKVEEELLESEDKFKYVFDHSVIGKSLTLPSGEINVNASFCKMLGYTAIELVNKKWQEISHAGDIENTQKIIDSLISGEKESARFTKRYLHKNGSVVWTEVTTSLRRDSFGKPIYFMSAILDITEWKNAEVGLRLKNLVFDSSLAANSISDINGNITEVNNAFVQIWGCRDKDEAIGKPLSHFILDADATLSIINSLQKTGEWEGDYTARRMDGTTFIAHGLATAVKDDTGMPIGFQSAVLDITEKKQADEKLALLALRQEAILSSVPDIIMEVDKNKVYTWANQTGIEFFGPEVIGKSPDYYFAGDQETFIKVEPLFSGSPDIIYLESWQRRKDGTIRLLGWWCRVLKDEKGNVTGALSTARDITENNKLTRQIEEERNKLASLLSSIPDEVWFADTNKEFTLANPNALKEFGFESVDGIEVEKFAKTLEVFDSDGKPRPLKDSPPLRALSGEVVKNLEEIVLIPARKELRHRQVNAAPVKDVAGNIIGAVSVVRDITDLKRAESEIHKLNEELEQRVILRTGQLEQANKELEAFSYSVSHDLRAPLRAVHGYTKILLDEYDDKLDEEGKRLFKIVYSSATQMGELIDDLLNFSRIGRSSMNYSWLDMNKLARSAFEEQISITGNRKTIFKIRNLNKAFGDIVLIKQVWINLISNSIKYSSKCDNPSIIIGSRTIHNMIVYYVKDNGAGFDMNYKHKLFGVFQRLHNEKEYEGNGVGLAIVQRIINRHEGKVWAEGEVGKGATFYFSLPIAFEDKR
jgi:PAS domain S-box-containing protein